MNTLNGYWRLMRPTHWLKNGFVWVPLFFAGKLLEVESIIPVLLAFVVFSLVASSVYIINDIADRKQDAKHPKKKHRPIASKQISMKQAIILLVTLLAASGALLYFHVSSLVPVIGIYLALNLLYSFWLKHVPILDIVLVSSFYLLRVVGGGVVIETPISHWLMLCTLFVTLFLITGKRRAEFGQAHQRKVLDHYSADLIDHLLTVAVTLTLITYSLYTVLGVESPLAIYSIFFVLIGIFRYLFIIYQSKRSEYPEKIIVSDKIIIAAILGWIVFMYLISY